MNEPIELDALAGRALTHVRAGTTDRADRQMTIPVAAYLDEERYQSELAIIFRKLPLPVALSLELPEPGSYLARIVLDQPLLITRGAKGDVNVFLNVCRHRGARLCAEGYGKQRKFSCPYHSWTYNNEGHLTGVYGERSFGEIDRSSLSLTRLHAAERHGIIFAALDTKLTFDIDRWLGDIGPRLAALKLDKLYLVQVRELDSPGWKATLDGYLEVYHHDTVHRSTVGQHTIGNLLVHDTFGPHQRLTFARPALKDLDNDTIPPGSGKQFIRMIHSVFPNLSISGILGEHCLVSQVWPSQTPDKTLTRQFLLASAPPANDEERDAIENFSAMTLQAVRDEDYAIVSTIQSGLASGANEHFVFGRNEPGLQHYHSWVDQIMAGNTEGLGI